MRGGALNGASEEPDCEEPMRPWTMAGGTLVGLLLLQGEYDLI
jgi:hypothetical protein